MMRARSLLLLLLVTTGCSLVLQYEDLIQACTKNDECDEGYYCSAQTCLPGSNASDAGFVLGGDGGVRGDGGDVPGDGGWPFDGSLGDDGGSGFPFPRG